MKSRGRCGIWLRAEQRHQNKQNVDRRDHARFGRSEPAGENAAHDDHRDHHRQHGVADRGH